MKVLITGADGFVGKNLVTYLSERDDIDVVKFTRANNINQLNEWLPQVDFVFHLAGVNRPLDPVEFETGNVDFTYTLCEAITATGKPIPVLYTSSSQAELDNPYGVSKYDAERTLLRFASINSSPVYLLRLPNVFGKWARPNYNSVVATFCHNIARGLPIQINDPAAKLTLVYIDDVIARFVEAMDDKVSGDGLIAVEPQYIITVGQLADQLTIFRDSRTTLVTDAVGVGLARALYATYISYLLPEHFSYPIPKYSDPRGMFVEMLKTRDSGQFSFFTAHPGITRGGHYHHSKTEKFLVIKGKARFGFRHIVTGEALELNTSGDTPEIVETVPGWTHDITNIGEDEMIVMLWANEIFDRAHPDTYACPV